MTTDEIVNALDEEISRLSRARMLMAGDTLNKKPAGAVIISNGRKRVMSPEGRARIAAAQKLRWKNHKKAA